MKKIISYLDNFLNKIEKIGIAITGLAVMFMMFFISADVLGRNLFSISISGNYEIVQNYIMPLMVFPVIGYAYSEGMMPRVEFVLDKFSNKVRFVLEILILVVNSVFMFLLLTYSWDYMIDGFINKTAFVAGKNMYPVYFLYILPPISFGTVILEDVLQIMKSFDNR